MASTFFKSVSKAVKHWYLPLIAGIIFIALGVLVFATPLEAYLALALIFSISFLVSGISEIIFAISNSKQMEGWGWNLAIGILTALLGIILINNPAISIVTLPFVVGFVVLFRSIMAISTSLDMRNYFIKDWGFLFGLGIIGTVFSFILLIRPDFAGFTIVFWTGLALIAHGIFGVYSSIKLKKLHDMPKTISSKLKEKWNQVQAEILDEIAK